MQSQPPTRSLTSRSFRIGQKEISALRNLHRCHATVIRSSRPLYHPAINPAKSESNLAAEFARASHKGPALAHRIGAARFSRRVLILLSGPYARPDGLVAFLQRLGLEVVPVDNDPNGGDRAHDILDNEVLLKARVYDSPLLLRTLVTALTA